MDIHKTKEKHKNSLLGLPNVVGVGIGPKIRNGRATGKTAIKVYVSRKTDSADLSEQERIPPILEGIPTDVEVMDTLKAR